MRKAPSPAPRTPPPVSTSQPHVRTNSSNSAAQLRRNVSSSASPPSNQPLPVLVVTQQQSASPSQQAHPQQFQSHNTNSKKSNNNNNNNMSFDAFLQRRNEEIQRANARLQRQDQEMDQWVDAQQRVELQHLHNMMNKKQQAFFPTTTERVTVTSPPSQQQQSGSSAQSPQKLSHFYRGSEFASLQSTPATNTTSLQPTTSPYVLLDERGNSITPSQNTTHEHHKQLYEELKQRHREQQQQQQRLQQQQQQQLPRNNVSSSSPRPQQQQPAPTNTTTTTRATATATGAISASTSFRAPRPSVSGKSSSSASSQPQSTHRPSLTHSNNETPPNPQQRSTTIPATHHHAPPPSSHRAPPPSSTPPLFLYNLCDQILTPLGCLPAPLLFHIPPPLSGKSCEAAGRQRSSSNSAPSSSLTGAATEQLVHLLHAWLAQSPVLLQSTTTAVSSSSRDQKSSSHTHPPPPPSQRRSWRRMRRAQKARLIALLWHVVNRVVFYSIRALTPPTGEGDETAPLHCPTTLTETTPSSTLSSSAPAQEKKSHQSKTSSSSTSSAAAAVERLLRAAGVPSSHSHSTHSSSSTAATAGERGSTTNTNATTTTPSSSSSMLLLPLAQWALTLRCLAEQQYPRIRSLSVGGPPTEQCGIHLTMMMMTSPNESETNIPFDDDMYEEENVERETTTTTAEDEEEDSCMDQTVLELCLALCWLIQKHRLPAVAGLVQLRARAPFLFERVTAPSDREDGSKERDPQTYDDVAPPVPPSPPPVCFSYPACDTWGHLLDLPTITGTAAAATFTKNTTTTAVEEAERRQGHALRQLWAHRAAETEDLFRHLYNGLHRNNNNNKSPPPPPQGEGCREGTRGVLEALHSVHTALEQSHRLLVERDALLWSGGLLPSAAGSSTVGAVIPCPLDAVLSLPAHAALYEEVRRGMRHVVEELPAAVECVQQSLRDFGDCLVTMATALGVQVVVGSSAARGVGIMQRGTTSINRSCSDHEARLRRQRQELAWSHALAEDRESLSRHHSEPHNDDDDDDDDGDDPPSLAPQQKVEDCPPHSGVEGRSMRMMTSRAKVLLRSFESSDSYRLLTSVFDQQQQQPHQAVVDDDPQAVTVRLMRERYSLQSCLAAEWWSRHCRRANRPPRCDDATPPQPPQRHSDSNRSASNERNQNEEKHKNNWILRRERSSSAHSEARQAMRLASMLRTQFRTVLTPTTSTHPSTNNNHNNGTKNKDVSKAQIKSASGHGKVGGGRRGECPAAPVCFSPRLIGFRLWQGGKSTAAASSSSSAVAETQRLLELCRELQAAFDLEKKVPHHAATAVAELRRTPSTAESTSSPPTAVGLRMVTRFGWRGGTNNENRAAQE